MLLTTKCGGHIDWFTTRSAKRVLFISLGF